MVRARERIRDEIAATGATELEEEEERFTLGVGEMARAPGREEEERASEGKKKRVQEEPCSGSTDPLSFVSRGAAACSLFPVPCSVAA